MTPKTRDFVMLQDGRILWCETQGGWGHLDVLREHFGEDHTEYEISRLCVTQNVLRGVYLTDRDIYQTASFEDEKGIGHITSRQVKELKDLAIISGRDVEYEFNGRTKTFAAESRARTIIDSLVHPTKVRGPLTYPIYVATGRKGDIITAAAIQFPDGTVVTGEDHPRAWARAAKAGLTDYDGSEDVPPEDAKGVEGFFTRRGQFLNRKDAYGHAKAQRQLDPEFGQDPERLDSLDVAV